MSLRSARLVAVAFFVLFGVAVTWPGMVPVNRVFPLVLGLPLNMVWIAAWLVCSVAVLWWLDSVEDRHR